MLLWEIQKVQVVFMWGLLSTEFKIWLSNSLYSHSVYICWASTVFQCTRHGSGTQGPFVMDSVLKEIPYLSDETENKKETDTWMHFFFMHSKRDRHACVCMCVHAHTQTHTHTHRDIIESGSWSRRYQRGGLIGDAIWAETWAVRKSHLCRDPEEELCKLGEQPVLERL